MKFKVVIIGVVKVALRGRYFDSAEALLETTALFKSLMIRPRSSQQSSP